ncbi:probable G-protein coupled receptor 146 isoform X1 [Gorilla gorilla gorilla]|nr:probable G-protein coupled receptor 146 isoform X1 [Gorilla gorilla gorilla]
MGIPTSTHPPICQLPECLAAGPCLLLWGAHCYWHWGPRALAPPCSPPPEPPLPTLLWPCVWCGSCSGRTPVAAEDPLPQPASSLLLPPGTGTMPSARLPETLSTPLREQEVSRGQMTWWTSGFPRQLQGHGASPAAMWSCSWFNGTGLVEELPACQDLQLGLSLLSLLGLVVGVPVGLCYNALLVLANLHSKASMTMPDVYFVNMAVAGLVLSALAPVHLLGPPSSRWALWSAGGEVHVALQIPFNVSSLVAMYSTALLSLDHYIERALPRTYMASVYNTRHVCGFVWGGALLTSFSSLLFYICSHVSTRALECAKMQNAEAADATLVFIGYVVPALAALYALVLLSRVRREDTPLDRDTGRLEPSAHRLLVATVCTQFGLWTPHYLILLGHTVIISRGKPVDAHYLGLLHFVKDFSKLLAFSSSFVTPLLYRYMNQSFPSKLRRLMKKLPCGDRHCSPDHMGVQQVLA